MKTFQPFKAILLFSLSLIISSCEKENPDKPQPVSLEKLSGQVQKGPFLNGTSITVAELNSDLGIQLAFEQGSANLEGGILIEYFENGSETPTRSKLVYAAQ